MLQRGLGLCCGKERRRGFKRVVLGLGIDSVNRSIDSKIHTDYNGCNSMITIYGFANNC